MVETTASEEQDRSAGGASSAVPHTPVAVTLSRRLARTPLAAPLLGADELRAWRPFAGPFDAVATRTDSLFAERAKALAASRGVPLLTAEDGWVCSVTRSDPPLSLVVDDLGHHADARAPSRLESLLAARGPGDPLADAALLARAEALLETWRRAGLSRHNDAPRIDPRCGERFGKRRVLVIDQPGSDPSIESGMATAADFETMLAAAEREHPNATVVLWRDPEAFASDTAGAGLLADRGLPAVEEPFVPSQLFEHFDAVYTVTSRLGFEAVLAGVPTVCFGTPFYAGWGLTDDRGPACVRRARDRSALEVFAAAAILCSTYVDPDRGGPGRAEHVFAHLALQRQTFAKNRGRLFCVGFHSWKRRTMRRYLRSPGNSIVFANTAERAERLGFDSSARLLTWGQRGDDAAATLMAKHGVPRWRVEDAFLRSVGLGSDITAPASLVLDREGIYYDPRTSSELERILESGDITEADVERAAALRQRIVESRLSKYNVGKDRHIETPADKRVVLVPGQVSDDASVQLGCDDIRTNAGLLEAAREAAPDAFLIFKPHPDVVSGNRDGRVPAPLAQRYADRIIDDVSLADCLAASDEVHTMTSLVGFEALLRGLRVFVYGKPFYAGWGLTTDRHRIPRRSVHLTIDELAAAALIRYPRYLHPVTARFTTPEAILDHLEAARDRDQGARTLKVSWPRRQARKLAHILREFSGAP